MAASRGQTHAKRNREVALREKRERKQAKKAEAAAQRATASTPAADKDGHAESAEWIR